MHLEILLLNNLLAGEELLMTNWKQQLWIMISLNLIGNEDIQQIVESKHAARRVASLHPQSRQRSNSAVGASIRKEYADRVASRALSAIEGDQKINYDDSEYEEDPGRMESK
jgi:hypothetical protein